MTHDDANRWLQAYVEAWRTYEPDAIGALFTADARVPLPPVGRSRSRAATPSSPTGWPTRTSPAPGRRATRRGRSRASASWPTGTSRYDEAAGKRKYHNVFLIELDADGRCRAFTEVYAKER